MHINRNQTFGALIISAVVVLAMVYVRPYGAQQIVSTTPATTMAGMGTPPALGIPCGIGMASASSSTQFDESDIASSNSLWKCRFDGTTFAWQAPANFQPPDLSGTGTIPGVTLLVNGCSATVTIAVSGAVVGHRVDVQNADGSLPTANSYYQGSVTSSGMVKAVQCGTLALVLSSKNVQVTVGA